MLTPKQFFKKPRFWRYAITFALVLVTFYAFRKEIIQPIQWLTGTKQPLLTDPQIVRDLFVLAAISIGSVILLFLFSWFISQFVLPVQSGMERRKVFARLWLYLLGMHGPAIFVKEGEKIAKFEELQSSRPGVAFVDLASAIVLEKQWFSGGARTAFAAGLRGRSFQRLAGLFRMPRPAKMQKREPVNSRAAGPGLVFTEFGERVRGTVSLRRQMRFSKVKGSMRDGFEISSSIAVGFTLGEPPEVLRIGYTGAGEETLRVIGVDEKFKTVKGLSNDLDADDRREAQRFVQSVLPTLPPLPVQPDAKEAAVFDQPFHFDERRVFNAVYGDARLPQDGAVEEWTELPLKIATEIFHNLVSLENYDVLYAPDKPEPFPFRDEFKPRFSRLVRNQGVLSFQFIRKKDGLPFAVGDAWDESHLEIYPVQAFRTSKVLRDRGIRILFASCSDLTPKDEVLDQRFLNWQAHWQNRADQTLALKDYQAMQIRAHARALAQKDMVVALSDLLKNSLPQEVLAIRLLQALEAFASQPETQKLLPMETLGELSNIQRWISNSPPLPSAPTSGVPPL